MNDCYLNFLVSFRALFSLDVGANLVNSKQTIDIILPDLSLLGYAVPVESFGIGLFVILFAYLIIEYNVQLLSHEKFKIAMNMLHTAHTPLILLRNQLEELKTGNLPEPLSQQVEEALGYAECIIYCNRNIATLNKVNKRIPPKTSTVNLELSTYVTSIVNQCRAHANSRQIRLTVGECSDCVSCRINENIMTAALQHLINKMILISESGCCISINVTHTMNSWQLQISNNEIAGQRAGKMFPFIPIIFPVYGYSDLWTVRKIIRLHGGKITGCCKLRADIRMLVENRMVLRERIRLFLSDAISPMIPSKAEIETENADWNFMDKVNKILEKNLSTDKYTIDKLSLDIGMSRTAFYNKIKEITGNPPEEYINSFKMDKALKLLASQQYRISDIASILGYCDAKYFGKKFKDFYHVCPSDYIKSIVG